MNYNAALTRVSGNAKTGPIATTVTGKVTCPDACPLKAKGCYAAVGPANIHWLKVSSGERGKPWAEFCQELASLPRGTMVRHNVAGDLPGNGVSIDHYALRQLIKASKGKRVFTYTHYLPDNNNAQYIAEANRAGLTINLSANNTQQAVEYMRLGIAPVVTLLPMDAPNVQEVKGVKVVACPAEKSDKVTCANCALCTIRDRDYVIGFRAHGVIKKHVELIAKG